MRTLHVAALPFPSSQGTQGLIHAMLTALHEQGHDAQLLCYPHGAHAADASYPIHRAAGDGASLRSGPSLEKLGLDAGLVRTLQKLLATLRPDAVIAHHVEAAMLALALASVPVLFVAHTDLAHELPCYFPRALATPMEVAGSRLDRLLVRRAARTLAVSPLLAQALAERAQHEVHALTSPWPVPEPITARERRRARRAFGLAADAEVLLYAGNLDAYQGLAPMITGVAALRSERPLLRVLLATEAPHAEATRIAAPIAGSLTIAPLAGESARRMAHAAADLALVPRLSPGGLPIKLLDALARGVPTVVQARALAGLPLTSFCEVVPDDAPAGWTHGVARALSDVDAPRRAEAARTYLLRTHSAAAFAAELEAHVTSVAHR